MRKLRTYRAMGSNIFCLTGLVGLCTISLASLSGCSGSNGPAYGQSGTNTAVRASDAENSQASAPLVKTIRPTREHLQRSTTQPAQVEPYEKTEIFAKVAGYLQKFGQIQGKDGKPRDVDMGDRVEKGAVLAELWIPEMEQERLQKDALLGQAQADQVQADASLKAAAAMVEAARAKVDEATALIAKFDADLAYRKTEHERYVKLFNERSTQKDLVDEKFNQLQAAESAAAAGRAALETARANLKVDEAKSIRAGADVESAKAHVRVARANLEQATILLNYGKIRAPFSGVVTRRMFDTGAFVQSAAQGKPGPLFTVVRIDRLRIVTEIPESDSVWIRIGEAADLQVNGLPGRHFSGKVVRFADSLDQASRTMRTEVELDAQAVVLRPGLYGAVTITLADIPDALVLPTSALLASSAKPAVMVVDNGKARRQEIELGLNDGVRMQVVRGLKGHELVITDGKNSLHEGQAVEIAK